MPKVSPIKYIIYSSKPPENKEDYNYQGNGMWVHKTIGYYGPPSNDEFTKRVNDSPSPYKKEA